jgi:hypothetical protein
MRDETQPPPGWYWLDKARGKLARVDGLSDLAGAWAEFDEEHSTQHPDAALRERLTALADRLEEMAAAGGDVNLDDGGPGMLAIAAELHGLTEPKSQHPNPLCPHVLECLCDESEDG